MKRPKTSKTGGDEALSQGLTRRGLRFTPQREHVFNVLRDRLDHPTAEQVFMRVKDEMPEISMATVYNCLDALVQCRLVKAVHLDRGPTRFCPNMRDHGHFHCEECGRTFDIDLAAGSGFRLPKGFRVTGCEVSIRGRCGDCNAGGGKRIES